ncbi:MAG TPA: hypothetical protein VL309_00915 [Vicinamibacterales bacterium]|jgi:uncharacterized sporulation protein YeaH/YhbH (DUF444 family)|nr:hypothetical protein [Vicinamibacterales bacterium]
MLPVSIHRHLPRSPLARRSEAAMRAEITHLSTEVLRLERSQEVQLARIAQMQQEIDELKRLVKKLSAGR